MRLYLIRHGQTEWNHSSRAQGHTDVSLDETGLRQSHLLGASLGPGDIDLVLSSDLKRSLQTAEPLAEAAGVPIELEPRLRERTFGRWEGDNYKEVGERLQAMIAANGKSLYDVRPPEGESLADVWERLGPVAERLEGESRTIAVVAHGGSTALLLARLVHGTQQTSRAFRFANTGVTTLHRRHDGVFYIVRYNDTSHLASEAVLSGDLDGTHR